MVFKFISRRPRKEVEETREELEKRLRTVKTSDKFKETQHFFEVKAQEEETKRKMGRGRGGFFVTRKL